MSPEQQAEKEFPLRSNADDFTYPGSAVTSISRAAFLSGVQWQRENGWLAYPENMPDNTFITYDTWNGKVIRRAVWSAMEQLFFRHVDAVVGDRLAHPFYPDVTHFRHLPPPPASIINK